MKNRLGRQTHAQARIRACTVRAHGHWQVIKWYESFKFPLEVDKGNEE